MKRGFTMALFLGLLLVGAGCSSSKDEIRRVAEESLATALAGVPTITPAPTASPQPTPSPFVIPATPTPFSLPPLPTPLPTATPVTFPPTVTPQPTSTPQPTATPQPTPTPVVFPATPTPAPTPTPGLPSSSGITTLGGQVSGPAVFRLPGDFSLTVNPSEPLAGRDVEFTLTGLPPWQDITVTFTDPLDRPVQWVTENEVVLVGPGDVPVTARNLYADGSGQVNWTRIGAKDQEGTWTVQVTVGGEVTSVTYPVTQLQLPHQDTETVGVELRRYQGSASDAFYSTLVPAATAIDLQAHLVWAVDRLSEDLRVQSPQIPDIYLAGNESLLQQVARATGDEIGYEDGYYRSTGNRPGIYMRTNLFLSNLRAVLTHEYTHSLLREVAPDHSLPAWLNEGIARHSEYALGLESANPDALRVLLYRGADLAKSSALSGTLPSLSSLESQTDWNSQVDDTRINLQYAESYMAIRFMVETYGVFAPIDVVDAMGRGSPLAAAMLEVTGSQYRDFRDSFVDWLQDWEDPERAGIRSYLSSLVAILTSVDSISERRAVDLQSDLPFSSRIPIKRGLVVDSQVLVDRLEGLSPPSMLTEVHQDASTYLSAVSQWLTLELEYVETLDQAKLFQANDMIPEINARDSLLLNKVNTVQFVYNLK